MVKVRSRPSEPLELIKLIVTQILMEKYGFISGSEESPNDFDKNHQVKVDTHLVM